MLILSRRSSGIIAIFEPIVPYLHSLHHLNPYIMRSITASYLFLLCFSTLLAQHQLPAELLERLPPEITAEILPVGPEEILPDDYRIIATYSKRWDNDEGDWVHADSIEYTYDENNNQTALLTLGWDGTLWNRSIRVTNTYNDQNQQTSYTEESWDGASWINQNGNSQILWEYDGNGNRTLWHRRTWQDGEWKDYFKFIYEYDPVSANLTSLIFQFALELGTLENANRDLFPSHDGQGNPLITIRQSWQNGEEWVTDSRLIEEYNDDGNRTSQLSQTPDGEDWIDSYRITYTYNNEALLSNLTRENWNTGAQAWMLYEKKDYSYNSNGDLTLILDSYRDENTASWISSIRTVFEYDEQFNLTNRLSQFWENDLAVWTNNFRGIFSSDTNGNLKTEEYQYWLREENEWQRDFHRTSYYEVFVDTEEIQILAPSSVTIAPNPGNGLFVARFDPAVFSGTEIQATVFNLMGQPLQSFKGSPAGRSFNIGLESLPGGTYLLHIRQGQLMVVKKVVIIK